MSETELEENWKDKYFKELLEQEKVEEQNQERFSEFYNELIHAFFHFKGRDAILDEALLSLPSSTDIEKLSISQIKDINRQIGSIHEQLSNESTGMTETVGMTVATETNFDAAKEAIQHLLDRLPKEVSDKINSDKLANSLENAIDIAGLKTVTEIIKDSISEILHTQKKQIKELSGFLGGISERLVSVKTHLAEEKDNRNASTSNRGDLTKLVENNLVKMRKSVADAEDLTILKQAIELQIDEIDHNVTSFSDEETDRANRAEKASRSLLSQIKKLETEAGQLKKSLDAAREEAIIDPLTGVSNRRAYDERFQVEYARWKRNHEPLTLAIMDIDHFKKINDDYGHPIGDKVLKVVAGRIQQQVRESDFFGRIGGEEFAFMLIGTNVQDSMNKIEALRESVQECNFRIKKKKFQVTMSIGIAEFKGKDSIQDVYNRADAALLKAKQSGRNKCLSEQDLKLTQNHAYEIQSD